MIYFHNGGKIIQQISFDIDTRMSSYVVVEIQPCNDSGPIKCKIPIAKIISFFNSPDSTCGIIYGIVHITNIVESR